MKKRNINIDVLKCIAVMFVLCVHFFLHTSYYGRSFSFKSIFYSSFIWIIFMTCVPLFIMVTGSLMKDKTYSKAYFLKLPVTMINNGTQVIKIIQMKEEQKILLKLKERP